MTTTPKPPEGYVIIVPEHGYPGMVVLTRKGWELSCWQEERKAVDGWDKKHNIYAVPISALKEQQVSEQEESEDEAMMYQTVMRCICQAYDLARAHAINKREDDCWLLYGFKAKKAIKGYLNKAAMDNTDKQQTPEPKPQQYHPSPWRDVRIKKKGREGCLTCEGYGYLTIRGNGYKCLECSLDEHPSEPTKHIDTEKESRRWQAFVAAMQGDWAAQENEVFGIFDLNMPKKSFEDRASIYKRAADAAIAVYYNEKKEGE